MNLTLPAADEEQPSVTDEDLAVGEDANAGADDKDNSTDKGSAEGSGQENGEQDAAADPEQLSVEE